LSAAIVGALNEILIKQGINPVPVPTYAKGGLAGKGLALVGENGPEIVNFESPASVLTANQTKSVLGDDGKTFQALEDIKKELKAIVTTQSNANPQLIDKLAGIEDRIDKMERLQRMKA
jgi:hypothetical protein